MLGVEIGAWWQNKDDFGGNKEMCPQNCCPFSFGAAALPGQWSLSFITRKGTPRTPPSLGWRCPPVYLTDPVLRFWLFM